VQAYTPLEKTIAQIFQQGQKTTAGHRKLVVNLRGVFDQCIAGTGSVGSTLGGLSGRAGEKEFTKAFCRFLNRVLVVKKSEVVGDRCLRLADGFIKNLVEGMYTGRGAAGRDADDDGVGNKKKKKEKPKEKDQDQDGDVEMAEEEEEEEDVHRETSATRVVLRILNHVLGFLSSKERGVRYRTTQFLALVLVNSLPTFPFDYSTVSLSIFRQLLAALTKRIHDKEAIVRVQASIGLVRLLDMGVTAASDAEEDSDDEQDGLVESILIESMQNDPSA
jgi:condensin complex subunit 3